MILKALIITSALLGTSQVLASSSPVNTQITDAISQTNVKVVGSSPASAVGQTYQLNNKIQNIINGCNAISAADDRCACYKNQFDPLMTNNSDRHILHSVVDQLCSQPLSKKT